MLRARLTPLCLVGLVLSTPGGPRAQPLQVPGVEVRDRPVEPEDPEGQPSAFANSHDLSGAATEARTLGEELTTEPGVQVRSLGGLGSFTAVLIRGSSPDQVSVFLDGIPLNPPGGGATDLASLPYFLMGRVDVYRSFLPAEFGSFGLGGAVNILPRWPTKQGHAEVFGSLGSWWTRRLGVSASHLEGSWAWHLAGTYDGTQGTFTYFDDHQTPYETSDDRFRTRQNNAYDGLQLLCLGRRRGAWKASVLEHLSWRRSELAGTASQPPVSGPFFTALRQVLGLRLDRRWPAKSSRVTLRLHTVYGYEEFSNPDGKLLSIGRTDSLQHSILAGFSGRYQWTWRTLQILSLVADVQGGLYRARDALNGREVGPQSRFQAGLALRDEWFLLDGRLYLAPVLRFDLVADWMEERSVLRWLTSPRLGWAYRPSEHVVLKANVGRYFRPPTFLELFGFHGVVRGRSDLKAESGWAMDLGAAYSRRFRSAGLNKLSAEAAVFGRRVSNLIYFLPSARALVATNWGEAWLAGAEASASVWLLRSLRVNGAYTFLFTRYLGPATYLDGMALPGRPQHVLHVRLDWVFNWRRLGLGLFGEYEYRSPFFRDLGNRRQAPSRTLLACGLKIRPWLPGLTITIEGRNLLNDLVDWVPAPPNTGLGRIPEAVSDYAGYPLPGRAIYLTVNWTPPRGVSKRHAVKGGFAR